MGTAHAGHDQCAHCYFQYVKPALQAERQEMKRRRAIKKGLVEPAWQAPPETATPTLSGRRLIRRAIDDLEIDHLVEGKTKQKAVEALADELIKSELPPPDIYRIEPFKAPEPEPEPELQKETETIAVTVYKTFRDLTAEERKDIADAYTAGLIISDVCKTWNITSYTLYQVTKHAGLPLRTGAGQLPAVWVPSAAPSSPPVPDQRLEWEKEEPMPQNTPAVSSPDVESAPANGVVSGLTEWLVTYTVTRTETTIVAAKDFNSAAASITDGDVISVAKKGH